MISLVYFASKSDGRPYHFLSGDWIDFLKIFRVDVKFLKFSLPFTKLG